MSATTVYPGTAPTQLPARLNRTCTACRQRKIKCSPLAQDRDAESVSTCTRCWKYSLSCVFPPSARKKTRRRNEDKIRDLESRLEAVQAAVESGLGHKSPPDRETTSSPSTLNETPSQTSFTETGDAPPGHVVTDEFVSPELAEKLYQSFINDLAPLYPLVSVSGSSTWQSIRSGRPALFRAMIAAASTTAEPEISARIFRETAQFLAEKVVVAGEKSLDLIQALLVLSTWHLPPSTFTELKFSQYAHMAATMVTDLRSSNDKRYSILTPSEPSHESVEICRTFLATYFLCSR